MDKTILKTLLFFSDATHIKLYKVDTIEHQGKKWLVTAWLDNPLGGWRSPERMICLNFLKHQKTPDNPDVQFVLNQGIPKSVFDGQLPPQGEHWSIVIERPDIRFPITGRKSIPPATHGTSG